MKKVTLLTLLALSIAGCSHDTQQRASTVSVAQADGQVDVARDPQRVVSFDYGSYDTLIALGVGDRVVATPASMPPYLADKSGKLRDAGGMKTPDVNTVRSLQPQLILITGRQGESRDALQHVAPTLDMGITAGDYFAGVAHNVELLGQIFDKSAEARQALSALRNKADKAREVVAASGKRTLVLTHNDGRFSPTEQPVIYSLLQAQRTLPAPAPQVPGAPRQRPQAVTADAIAAANPEIIFIIDRSAAIGATPLDVDTLAHSPLSTTPAARAKRIVYLDPALWYLSGGGLQSLDLQIDQVLAAYR